MPVILNNDASNVWKEFPYLNVIKEFKEFREKEGDEKAGNIIKAIFLLWDVKSELRDSGLTEEKLLQDINTNLIGDPDFNWDEYEDIKQFFLQYNMSEEEFFVANYKKELTELKLLLDGWSWTKKDTAAKAKAMGTYKDLFDDWLSMKEKVDSQRSVTEDMMEAGYMPSLFEQHGD